MRNRTLIRTLLALVFCSAPLYGQEGAVEDEPMPLPAYLEARDVPHGTVRTVAYDSRSLGTNREVVVYTPPGYESSAERYPVLYLLHGAGGNPTTWTERGLAHVILDNLIADGELDPLIVVMPDGFAERPEGGVQWNDAVQNRSQREGVTADLIDDVIPLVESEFRVIADREHRAIGGLSLGGAQSMAIGLQNLDLFSRIAAFSSAFHVITNPETGGLDFDTILADAGPINDQLDFLWVGCGFDDVLFDRNVAFDQMLTRHGIEHTFRVTEGEHEYPVWQRYLYEVAPQLF